MGDLRKRQVEIEPELQRIEAVIEAQKSAVRATISQKLLPIFYEANIKILEFAEKYSPIQGELRPVENVVAISKRPSKLQTIDESNHEWQAFLKKLMPDINLKEEWFQALTVLGSANTKLNTLIGATKWGNEPAFQKLKKQAEEEKLKITLLDKFLRTEIAAQKFKRPVKTLEIINRLIGDLKTF